METIFLDYLAVWKPLALLAIVLGIMLEGEMVLFTAAFLTQQGWFGLGEMLPAVMAAAHVGDWSWYGLGRRVCLPGAALNRWICRLAAPLDRRLARDPSRMIFISKFVYGLNHLTLLRAGATKIEPGAFAKGEVLAATMWTLVIGGLGYFFGASVAFLKEYIRYSELALLAGLSIFLCLRWFLSRQLKKGL